MKPQLKLKIALQKDGRLTQKSFQLLKGAGFDFEQSQRSLVSQCKNFPLEIFSFRASDIPEVVNDGTCDLGICGQNTIFEKGYPLKILNKLRFGACRLSLAVPGNGKFDSKLDGKRIATSYPNILKNYLKKKNLKAEIVEFSGSIEIAPRIGIADAICDIVSSGSTLKMNGLQELESILTSEAILVQSSKFTNNKRILLDKFLMRIQAVLSAKQIKYIILNAPKKAVKKIQSVIPGLKNPTISTLTDPSWVSFASVVKEDIFWETIEKLKQAGATGILVLPIEKMIL